MLILDSLKNPVLWSSAWDTRDYRIEELKSREYQYCMDTIASLKKSLDITGYMISSTLIRYSLGYQESPSDSDHVWLSSKDSLCKIEYKIACLWVSADHELSIISRKGEKCMSTTQCPYTKMPTLIWHGQYPGPSIDSHCSRHAPFTDWSRGTIYRHSHRTQLR